MAQRGKVTLSSKVAMGGKVTISGKDLFHTINRMSQIQEIDQQDDDQLADELGEFIDSDAQSVSSIDNMDNMDNMDNIEPVSPEPIQPATKPIKPTTKPSQLNKLTSPRPAKSKPAKSRSKKDMIAYVETQEEMQMTLDFLNAKALQNAKTPQPLDEIHETQSAKSAKSTVSTSSAKSVKSLSVPQEVLDKLQASAKEMIDQRGYSVIPQGLSKFDQLLPRHYSHPYNYQRRAKLALFSEMFLQHPAFTAEYSTADQRYAFLERIERSCYNAAVSQANKADVPTKWDNLLFVDIYSVICCKISSNIDQTNDVRNPWLCSAIMSKKIDVADLPGLSSQELYPSKYVTIIDKLLAARSVERTYKTSALYTCKRCKQKKCTIVNLYNRSADEGVSQTITCNFCGLEMHG